MKSAKEYLKDFVPTNRFVTDDNPKIWTKLAMIEFAEAYHKAKIQRKIERINNITQPSFSEILHELKQ